MNNFFKLVNQAISFLDEKNTDLMANEPAISIPDFNKMCRTVHINVGRNTGKTSYIKQRVTGDDCILTHNWTVYSAFRNTFSAERFVLSRYSFDGTRYDKIYIDEPGLIVSNSQLPNILDIIYEVVSVDRKQTFILLGE